METLVELGQENVVSLVESLVEPGLLYQFW